MCQEMMSNDKKAWSCKDRVIPVAVTQMRGSMDGIWDHVIG